MFPWTYLKKPQSGQTTKAKYAFFQGQIIIEKI